jgi:hypothetical protein
MSGTCWACEGYGHFNEYGKPSTGKEDRACLECGGSGIEPTPAPTNQDVPGKEEGEEEELARRHADSKRPMNVYWREAHHSSYLAGLREGKRLGYGERVAPFVREHREALERVIAERDAAQAEVERLKKQSSERCERAVALSDEVSRLRELLGEAIGGLTKREYFAGLAMQGILAMHAHRELNPSAIDGPEIVQQSVACADALLNELAKACG